MQIRKRQGELPGGPVVRIWMCFHCWGLGLTPSQESKMPQAMWHAKKKEEISLSLNMLSQFVISLEEGPEKFGT